MRAPLLSREAEKVIPYAALITLLDSGGQPNQAEACAALRVTVARAKRALAVLEMQPDQGPAWRVYRAGLSTLTVWAEAEIERAEHFALHEIGHRLACETATMAALDTVILPGTIISYSDCGAGLYKVSPRATTEDIVCDDGSLLVPLNTTIPSGTLGTRLRILCVGDGCSGTARFTPCNEGGSSRAGSRRLYRRPRRACLDGPDCATAEVLPQAGTLLAAEHHLAVRSTCV